MGSATPPSDDGAGSRHHGLPLQRGPQVELARVRLTPLQRENRIAFLEQTELSRQQTAAGRRERMLAVGEKLVLVDAEGDYFGGTVIDAFQPGGEITYLVAFAALLNDEVAMRRLHRDPWQVSESDVSPSSGAVQPQTGPRRFDALGEVGA